MNNKQNTGTAKQAKENTASSLTDKKANKDTQGKSGGDMRDIKGQAENAKQNVKETANNAVGQAKNKAVGIIDEKKSSLTSGLNDVADTIRKVGENLREADNQTSIGKMTSQYGENIAGTIENFSSYLDEARLNDIRRDVEDFARRQPLLFAGGAFALGLLAARFLKSSEPDRANANYYQRRYGA